MRRALVAVALAGLVLGMGAADASAHALIASSSPSDGELLDAAPAEVLIDFTEAPDLGLSKIEVLSEGGPVETGELAPAGSRTEVAVGLPDLADGVYTVSWRVLSTVDGHVTAGTFSFGVGVESAEVPVGGSQPGQVQAPPPSASSVAGRWGLYWGLALLLGLGVAGLAVFRGPIPHLRGLTAVAWLAGAAGLGLMLWAESSDVGVSAGELLGSERGRLLILRGVALGGAGLAALGAALAPRRPWFALLAVAVVATMGVHAYAGHAGAASSGRWVKVGVQWAHIVGVGVWIGGLAWFLAGLLAGGERGEAIRRFSRLAGYALAVVALTGLLRAVDEVGSLGAVIGSGFGLSALGKTALFAGMVALGAYNRYRLVPALAVGGLRRTVTGELALAAGVLGLTGVMAGLVPPGQGAPVAASAPPERVVVSGTDFGNTIRVRLTATPGTPGLNELEVVLRDPRTGEPVDAERVRLRFALPASAAVGTSELELEPREPGRWGARGTNLSLAGAWSVGVLIEQAADSRQVNLELATRQEVQVIEGGPGQPTLYTISLPEGRSVQSYVDPGEPGRAEVHFTFFEPGTGETPIEEFHIAATPGGGEPVTLEPRRLSEGHVVATVELTAGTWTFRVEATAGDGMVLSATFEEEIEG